MKKSIFTITKFQEESFYCDDCGTCFPEGLTIDYNGSCIWKKYSDGHLHHEQTEKSILDSILDTLKQEYIQSIEENFTENKRLEWSQKHIGSHVSSTQEAWAEYKKSQTEYIEKSFQNIYDNCKNLPYDEALQVKMIALWVENEFGEEILVQKE
jgi:hydroxymethylpyrimidine pyrophosphatase-like HAD family hydrolase